jgi:metal-dependent amidase/aminoacylase/carboxypeptidase family protein
LTIGQLIGGDNPNVIPECVELRGTLRTLDRTVRERTLNHIRQLARGIAEASGTSIELFVDASMDSVRNDSSLIELIDRAASDVVAADGIQRIARPSMGSEDFAAYLSHIPGAMMRLGCASPTVGGSALHTPTFDIDEAALAIGARIFVRAAILWAHPDGLQAQEAEQDLGAHI